jgi:aminobenzoyl-glutamate utilization protein A
VLQGETIGAAQSEDAARIVEEVGARVPGIGEVVPEWPIGGGDDATYMLQRVQQRGGQAVYFILGSDIPAVHHATDFDIDEASLHHGVDLFGGIAERVLGGAR